MEIEAFLKERRPRWDRLERILDRVEESDDGALDPRSVQELVLLYRQACSDLNHARSLTADAALLDRLNLLTGRGYRYVYRDTRRAGLWTSMARLFLDEIPAAFRKEAGAVGTAAGAMLLGALFGFAAVSSNRAWAQDLVPGMFMTESPKDRVEQLEKNAERIGSVGEAATFGASLFTHNIQVSFLAFSLGAVSIVGGYWILFYNGVILGAVAAQYWLDGVTTFFMAWVGPHGALELPAIVFAGAAGIRAGRALLLPGTRTVSASLREAFPSLRRMLLASAAILVLAGLIEGSFSQFTKQTVAYGLKIAVAVALFVLLLAYLYLPRRGAAR